ncbi:hypothetical protein [Aeromonas hydrophila]|uniref:hypothetical protein n=1 Tax=Aeromonas hydrophila TaxID=644 RepID=UPI0039889540
MTFDAMLSGLCHHLYLPPHYRHADGLDIPAGPFTLHIRQQDRLVTLFIPLGDLQTTSLANMADWPILQLSNTDERNTLLWAREWLDKLNQEIMVDLISRMLHQAQALTLDSQPSTTLSGNRHSAALHG